jgi:hypothetical protein
MLAGMPRPIRNALVSIRNLIAAAAAFVPLLRRRTLLPAEPYPVPARAAVPGERGAGMIARGGGSRLPVTAVVASRWQ